MNVRECYCPAGRETLLSDTLFAIIVFRTCKNPEPRLCSLQRWIAAIAGVALISGLGLAFTVKPDDRGFGTHHQFGLPPCAFFTLFGKQCPSCGMTTSWAYFVRGEFGTAIRTNAGGSLLASSALIAGPWLLVSAALGRWFLLRPRSSFICSLACLVVLITLLDWVQRIWL